MHSGSPLMRSLFLVVTCLFIAANSARADKNNKFEINLSRYKGNSSAYFIRAMDAWDKNNMAAARQLLDAAIKDDSALWPAYLMRAQVWVRFGKYNEALQDCNAAARLKPQFTRTFIVRAHIYRALGRCAEGVADLDKVIAIHSTPESVAFALSSRAWLRANCQNTAVHDPKKALEDAIRACKLDGWHMADYVDTLALACAVNGDFESAIKYQKQAIASGRFEPGELKEAESHLDYYEKHQGHKR